MSGGAFVQSEHLVRIRQNNNVLLKRVFGVRQSPARVGIYVKCSLVYKRLKRVVGDRFCSVHN